MSALQGCKDAKDVVALAKTKGIDLTEEKAGKILGFVHNDKLSYEELEKVVGGVRDYYPPCSGDCGIDW